LNIIKIYNDPHYNEPQNNHKINRNESNESNQYRWSFDISSLQTFRKKDYIFVAISYIDLENDMKSKERININETIRDTKNEYKNNNVINKELIKESEESETNDYIKNYVSVTIDDKDNSNSSRNDYIEYYVSDNVDNSNSSRKKTIIYGFKIVKNDVYCSLDSSYTPTCCFCNYVSGIPKFINNEKIVHSKIQMIKIVF
jgi:hypothetical protein